MFRVAQDFRRKSVGKMVFANDDLCVDPEVAGAAENFDHAADRGLTAAGIPEDFDIYYGAFEFGELRKSAAA
jgi:hypothetical protein